MSPTSRSKQMMEKEGYKVWIVEQTIRIPGRTFKRDLFNAFDLIGLRDSETKVVQTTTLSNLSARLKKLEENEYMADMRKAGWTMEAHGWRKLKTGWAAKIVDVS